MPLSGDGAYRACRRDRRNRAHRTDGADRAAGVCRYPGGGWRYRPHRPDRAPGFAGAGRRNRADGAAGDPRAGWFGCDGAHRPDGSNRSKRGNRRHGNRISGQLFVCIFDAVTDRDDRDCSDP